MKWNGSSLELYQNRSNEDSTENLWSVCVISDPNNEL